MAKPRKYPRVEGFQYNRNAVFDMHYHLIIVTKYRHSIIDDDIFAELKDHAIKVFETGYNCKIEAMEHNKDHIHIVFSAQPQHCISDIVRAYKGSSSRNIKTKFAGKLKPYYWKDVFWSESYMLYTTGGAPLEIVKQYVENQRSR